MAGIAYAKSLWRAHSHEAQWEIVDFDEMTLIWVCEIHLNIKGYQFKGHGTIFADQKRVESISCVTPKGTYIKIL